jgi:DNA polymerase
MPTYHPAYLLRNPSQKRQVWEDVQKIMKLLVEGSGEEGHGYEKDAT